MKWTEWYIGEVGKLAGTDIILIQVIDCTLLRRNKQERNVK